MNKKKSYIDKTVHNAHTDCKTYSSTQCVNGMRRGLDQMWLGKEEVGDAKEEMGGGASEGMGGEVFSGGGYGWFGVCRKGGGG
jgi:hypothetical protein